MLEACIVWMMGFGEYGKARPIEVFLMCMLIAMHRRTHTSRSHNAPHQHLASQLLQVLHTAVPKGFGYTDLKRRGRAACLL